MSDSLETVRHYALKILVSLVYASFITIAIPWVVPDFAKGFPGPRLLQYTVIFIFGFVAAFLFDPLRFFVAHSENRATTERIREAEDKADAAPEKAKFAWDVARIKLEAYFDRNLSQVNQIFYFAVVVMIIGFSFVLWAVRLSVGQPTVTPTSLVAAIAGIISEFIGTTFMVIYRSTMAQANNFMSVLERINTVGMAVQVLDSMPDGEAKNAIRGRMTTLLLNANLGNSVTVSQSKDRKR